MIWPFSCVCFLPPPHRRWHHWGHTGWRWMVRVSPHPWLQSISGRVQRSTHSYTVDSILSAKSTQVHIWKGDKCSLLVCPRPCPPLFIFCAVFLLNSYRPCLTCFLLDYSHLPHSPFSNSLPPVPAVKPDRHHHVARSEDGRLFYDNQWYCRGQAICINRKDEYPTRCVCVCVLLFVIMRGGGDDFGFGTCAS